MRWCNGAPGWIRTSGHSLRRRVLYPTELRARERIQDAYMVPAGSTIEPGPQPNEQYTPAAPATASSDGGRVNASSYPVAQT